MAIKLYPRFLFSDPQSTKSKGPFIIHTASPFLIFKVHRINESWKIHSTGSVNPSGKYWVMTGSNYALEWLNFDSNLYLTNTMDIKSISERAHSWFQSQLSLGEIIINL